jgi:hypothetical protein
MWRAAGRNWAKGTANEVPDLVKELWGSLAARFDDPLYKLPRRPDQKYPPWWESAYGLFVISDEACAGLGYTYGDDIGGAFRSWISGTHYKAFLKYLADFKSPEDPDHYLLASRNPPTTTIMVDTDVICVQPKSRTAGLGCTLRTLSHNLAALPPRGHAKVLWYRPNIPLAPEDPGNPMRLLAIPYPFKINREDFKTHKGTHETCLSA